MSEGNSYAGAHATTVHDDPQRKGYGKPDEVQSRVVGGRASILPKGDKYGGNSSGKPIVNLVTTTADGVPVVQRVSEDHMYVKPPEVPTAQEPQMIPPPSRQPQVQPEYVSPQPSWPTPTANPPAVSGHEMNELREMMAMMRMLVPTLVANNVPRPVTPAPAPVPAPAPENQPDPVIRDPEKRIEDPLATLRLEGLRETAQEPQFRVEFYLGAAGRQQAWYHWVDEGQSSIALIFDTRFRFGTKYVPPGGKAPIKIKVWLKDSSCVYTVYSCDLVVSLGVFEMLILPRAAELRAGNSMAAPTVEPPRGRMVQPTYERQSVQEEPEYSEEYGLDPDVVASFQGSVLFDEE